MEKLTEWPGSSPGGTGLGLVHGYVLSAVGGARVEASARSPSREWANCQLLPLSRGPQFPELLPRTDLTAHAILDPKVTLPK